MLEVDSDSLDFLDQSVSRGEISYFYSSQVQIETLRLVLANYRFRLRIAEISLTSCDVNTDTITTPASARHYTAIAFYAMQFDNLTERNHRYL